MSSALRLKEVDIVPRYNISLNIEISLLEIGGFSFVAVQDTIAYGSKTKR